MGKFTGTLNANEFYNSLFNAYKLITTYADNLDGLDRGLSSRFKVDGGRYRDKSVYTSMDCGISRRFDKDDSDMFKKEYKVSPNQQEIVMSNIRQIGLMTDEYLTPRAWGSEDSFNQFNSVVQSQVGNTEKLFEETLVNTTVGTLETSKGKQQQKVVIPALDPSATYAETEAYNRVAASKIANKIADLFVALKKPSRDFNDYGYETSFNKSDLLIIWNADYINKIEKRDLPTMFHKEGLISFEGEVLPGEYFGTINAAGTANGTTNLAYDEYLIRVDTKGEYSATGTAVKNVKAGEILPKGTPIVAIGTPETFASADLEIDGQKLTLEYASAVHAYTPDSTIICKIMHKGSIKYLSGFKTSTEFFNRKNLTDKRWLTWMYARPEYLYNYPLITLREAQA